MKYFLLVVIVALCGGAYYEYTVLQKNQQAMSEADQKQISNLNGQIDKLKAANTQLESDKAGTEKSLMDAQSQATDLTAQLQTAKAEAETAKKEAEEAKKTASAATEKAKAAGPQLFSANYLGTIATLDGKTYENCVLLKVDTDGITLNHESQGITKILFVFLPPELQAKFGYDFHKDLTLTPEQVHFQEALRKNAALKAPPAPKATHN